MRASLTVLFAVFGMLLAPYMAHAQAADASLFRVFLLNGDTLVSYGEFARVGDRVVVSIPLGDTPETRKLHLVSVPADKVDWPRTDEYAMAVRAKRYAETQGEDDYTMLAARVTTALNDIHLAPDPKRRAAMAEEARRNLAAWPAANYGYRAADVAQLVEMLDGVVAEMRAEAGQSQFDVALVANTLPPAHVPVLPAPDVRETLEAGYRAALAAAEPSERISLLRVLEQELSFAPKSATWAPELRARALAALTGEVKVEHAYADLTKTSLRDAASRAGRGDVRGLQQIIARALLADDRLGRQRTGEMAALLAALDSRLDEATRVYVAQQAFAARVDIFRAYQRTMSATDRQLREFRRQLEQIRARRGTSSRALQRLEIQSTMALQSLDRVKPPPEMQSAHGLYVAALNMTRHAASIRRNALSALSSGHSTSLARDASSAAAGALMLAERAADEVSRLVSASAQSPR